MQILLHTNQINSNDTHDKMFGISTHESLPEIDHFDC